MQLSAKKNNSSVDIDAGEIRARAALETAAGVDRTTLAGLDVGLFRALQKLGTSKQRICSALWLSYAEYDELSKLI